MSLPTLYYNKLKLKLSSPHVTWYTCGPTVYDKSHIGHARTYIMTDVAQRILEYNGYTVTHGMNFTDIDDKIIKKAQELGISVDRLTEQYTKEFQSDMERLHVLPPDLVRYATQHETIEMIQTYINKYLEHGYAYVVDGSVYLDTVKTESLIGVSPYAPVLLPDEGNGRDCKPVSAASVKKDKRDFVLWKASRPGEPTWEYPSVGPGRPGWHIECSAMIELMYTICHPGLPLTIHSGGIDLKFPHHNNEYIQSTLYNALIHRDVSFVQEFVHIGHLHIKGCKMSKSVRNFISIDEALKTSSPNAIRMAFLLHNSSKTMDYSEISMKHAGHMVQHFKKFNEAMESFRATPATVAETTAAETSETTTVDMNLSKTFADLRMVVRELLTDLASSPHVINELHVFSGIVHKYMEGMVSPDKSIIKKIAKYYLEMYELFGLRYGSNTAETHVLLETIQKIRADIRAAAKDTKEPSLYALSDKIRDVYLKDAGIQINDR